MEDGEWIMVNGEFLTRITLILRMARIGEREGRELLITARSVYVIVVEGGSQVIS